MAVRSLNLLPSVMLMVFFIHQAATQAIFPPQPATCAVILCLEGYDCVEYSEGALCVDKRCPSLDSPKTNDSNIAISCTLGRRRSCPRGYTCQTALFDSSPICCPKPCKPLRCRRQRYCPYGFKLKRDGCPTCRCNKRPRPEGTCPAGDPLTDEKTGAELFCGRPPLGQRCPYGSFCEEIMEEKESYAVCCQREERTCPLGSPPSGTCNGVGVGVCPYLSYCHTDPTVPPFTRSGVCCECAIPPCPPPPPGQECEFGFELDSLGCPTCTCLDVCKDYDECEEGEECVPESVVCIQPPCPPVPTCVEKKCPLGNPLTDDLTGEELYCGRGTTGECPDLSYCVIDPTDRFAVCCPICPVVSCLPPPYQCEIREDEQGCPSICDCVLPDNVCQDYECDQDRGLVCVEQKVECVTEPCPPVPQCIPKVCTAVIQTTCDEDSQVTRYRFDEKQSSCVANLEGCDVEEENNFATLQECLDSCDFVPGSYV